MTPQDLSRPLARYIAASRYEDIPPAAVDRAKKSVFDLIGVILAAGGTAPAARNVLEVVRLHGGTPSCTVLGFADRAPPMMAALANGAMAHCLDFDDLAPDGNHATSTLLPAVLALAEHRGGLSGKELITAVAVGQDVFLRLRRSLLGQRMDWLTTTVLGVFSATAASARTLGLNAAQTANALGIASLGSCGTLEMRFGTGSDLGEIYAGFVAKNAVLAAMLAQTGVTGLQQVFEGQAGIMKVYFGNQYDRDRVLDGLGRDFHGASMQYKPWPICGIANTYVHAMLGLVRDHRLAAGDIVQVRAHVGDFQQRMCYPLDQRRRPAMAMDARFSIPFCLAAAATYGEVRIAQFTEAGLRDPKVLAMADRIVPADDSTRNWTGTMPEARLEVDTADGRTLVGIGGADTLGNPSNPMDWDHLIRKFADCAAAAAAPRPEAVIRQVVDLSMRLETLDDATQILRLLS